jgi:hypothetical protein
MKLEGVFAEPGGILNLPNPDITGIRRINSVQGITGASIGRSERKRRVLPT